MCSSQIALRVSAVLLILAVSLDAIPVSSNHFCPVPTSNSELETKKVLNLQEIKGRKVRLQFFYPSEESSRKFEESTESTASNSTNPVLTLDSGESPEKPIQSLGQDIFCQWTFQASNASQFLSLTFEKLSAPYSDNCAQAFVALQKENGYESRWCGNRRQANARPMSLLAKSSAVVTVYRSGRAPLLPVTGFKVSVKELDVGSLQGAENSLRVLLG